MKHIALAAILATLSIVSMANGGAPANPSPGPSTSNASASTRSSSVANASGGSVAYPNSWAVALPGHGSPSYAGNYSICVNGRGVGWNFFWSWQPDMECVKLIAELDRLARIPLPAPKVELLTIAPAGTSALPIREVTGSQGAPTCPPPAKAKSVNAAKKAGACKA